jgi:hypothetical protein
MTNKLERLERLSKAATPRPWRVAGHDDWRYVATGGGDVIARKANSEFIVAVVNEWSALLAALERAERVEAVLREECGIDGVALGERLACEVSDDDCGRCWGCRIRAALESRP